jgi:signal transduction histidine kinase
MFATSQTLSERNWPTLARRLSIDCVFGLLINTLCAIVVTYVMRLGRDFWESWVFAMCIGTTAMLLIDGGRLVFWGENRPSKAAFFAILIVSVPIAYFVGSVLAIEFLGLPMHKVFNNQLEHASGLLIFITLVCLILTWMQWSRTELSALKANAEAEKARTAAIERQAAQAQLQVLQAQIEPHMLFNTLANLQSLIAIDPPRAQHMLDQLIQFLRCSLSSSRAEKTTLQREFTLMQAYLELMSVRMGARLTYTLQLPEELHNLPMPPMLLQPVLENAIKHGLEAKIDGGHLDVHAARRGDRLILTVADTGLGLAATADAHYQNHGTEVGLANVRERLHALYGEQATFLLTPNTPCGAIAQFTLPLS